MRDILDRYGARLYFQEDQSLDAETNYTAELTDWLAIVGDGFLYA